MWKNHVEHVEYVGARRFFVSPWVKFMMPPFAMVPLYPQFGCQKEEEHEDHLSNWDRGSGLYWESHMPELGHSLARSRIGNKDDDQEPDDLDQNAALSASGH